MARTLVSIRSGVFSEDAQEISTEFFGGNMLFDRDRVGETGTYDEKAAALNLGLIRYPGGNVSEIFFDIANPDKTIEENGHSGTLMTLTEFIAYINDIDAAAAFVAPTVPFMDGLATGQMTVAEVKSEIRAFLTELKAGVYGDPSNIKHIEIGNEYYGYDKHFDWSAIDQYIEIAPIWAAEIRNVFGDDLNIGVQGGINRAQNEMLIETFKDKGDLVDSVIFHSYPWDLGQAYSRDVWKTNLSNAWEKAGISETVFMSEWGVSNMRYSGGQELGLDQIEDGLARGIAMVEIAALQIKSGVDFATVWPVQQNTRGDLAGNEGQTAENSAHFLSEDGLTVAGEAFQMMSEILPGMRMLDMGGAIDLDGKREKDRYAPELLVRGFEDDEKIVTFVSAWAIEQDLGEATLNLALGSDIASYDIATLTVAGDEYTNPNADPVTYEETGLVPAGERSISFSRDYELKRLVLHKTDAGETGAGRSGGDFRDIAPTLVGDNSSDLLKGDDAADGVFGNGGDDILFGFGAGDLLKGGAGADRLHGGDGFDFLDGGAGVDSLFSGRGSDSLAGGREEDFLKGQLGEDTLIGGAGDDTLMGGGQADKLLGGGGADLMKGGAGADLINGGGGADRLFGNGGGDVLSGRGGADRLYGVLGADTLKGGGGDDLIEIGPGEDIASGGAGADVFIIRTSSETATITDFQNGVDLIAFYQADKFADLVINQDGAGAVLSAGGSSVLLEGISPSQLSENDFIF